MEGVLPKASIGTSLNILYIKLGVLPEALVGIDTIDSTFLIKSRIFIY